MHANKMEQQDMTADSVDTASQSTSSSGVDAQGGLTWRKRMRAVWNALVAAIGLVMGIVPHVLHHIGLLAGTALVAGSGGTALFGALGFLASIPFLLRLYRRFGTWRAPVIGLLIFTAMFSLSTFVIGPAISGTNNVAPAPITTVDHQEHH